MRFFYFLTLTLLLSISFTKTLEAQVDEPILLCVQDTINNFITIHWINTHTCGADFVSTEVYFNDGVGGGFSLVETITDPSVTNYVHEDAASFSGVLTYYVRTNCTTGFDDSDQLTNESPIAPSIDYVTVQGEDVLVIWTADPGVPFEFGTRIYRRLDGSFLEVGILPDQTDSDFVDQLGEPHLGPQTYEVSTADACGFVGPFSGTQHTTMFLQGSPDFCDGGIRFEWTDYFGWPSVLEYRLMKDGVQIQTWPGTTAPSSFDYTLDPTDVGEICFTLEAARDASIFSSSNEICYDFGAPTLPQFIYMRNLSVLNNEIVLEWYIDENADVHNLVIERGTDPLGTAPVFSYSANTLLPLMDTIDNGINPRNSSFYYKITAEDTCIGSVSSNPARTILLTGVDNFNLSNTLSWNQLEIDFSTITEYRLYRNDLPVDSPLATFNPGDTSYLDAIGDINPDGGFYCYWLEAVYDLNLPNGVVETDLSSMSNEVCISQNSRIFMPNAFKPTGVNSIFKPTIIYQNPEAYRFVIMNRWGEILFETSDPDQGWDGRKNGEMCPQGVYAYIVKMESINGLDLERKGTLMLFK